MNDVDPLVAVAFDRFAVAGAAPDWQDVLRRAGAAGRPRRRQRLLLALVAAAAVAAGSTLPALGLGGRIEQLLGRGERSRGLTLVSTLHGPSGPAGTLTLVAPRGLRITRGSHGRPTPRVFVPGGRLRGLTPTLGWQLRLRRAGGAEQALIRRRRDGRVVARLCAPCTSDARGILRLALGRARPIFGGATNVEVHAGGETLSGRIALRLPASRR